MNYVETFKQIYGDELPAGKKAYAMDMPINSSNPVSAVAGHIPRGARVTMKNRVIYVLAEAFTHPSAHVLVI